MVLQYQSNSLLLRFHLIMTQRKVVLANYFEITCSERERDREAPASAAKKK